MAVVKRPIPKHEVVMRVDEVIAFIRISAISADARSWVMGNLVEYGQVEEMRNDEIWLFPKPNYDVADIVRYIQDNIGGVVQE